MNKIILVVCVLCLPIAGFSQTVGDFRSAGSGPWSTAGTWQTFDGTSWVAAVAPPSSTDGAIEVLSPHTVTVTANLTIDQTIIDAGATVVVNNSVTLTIANPTGTTVTTPELLVAGTLTLTSTTGTLALSTSAITTNLCFVNIAGTLNSAGSVTLNTRSRLFFQSGSLYNHQHSAVAGTIPNGAANLVTWDANSTCKISGYISNTAAPAGLNQTFGNFTWDTPGLSNASGFIDLAGQLTTVTKNLTINSLGGAGDQLSLGLSTAYTLAVGGDLIINDGNTVFGGDDATTTTITIGGNVTITNGSAGTTAYFAGGTSNVSLAVTGNFSSAGASNVFLSGGPGNLSATVGGSFSITGGAFDFASDAGTTDVSVTGNVSFSATGGSIASSSAATTFNFVGAAQTFTSTVAASGKMNYTVNSGTILTLNSPLTGGAGSASSFTLNGTVNLSAADALGAIQTGTSGGSIRVGTTRTYNTGSTIVYATGTTAIGNGHPSASGISTVINNSAGVSLASNTTIGGDLTLTAGNLTVGSRTLTLNGNFIPNSNSLVITSSSNLTIGGTGSFGNLATSGSTSLNNFTINRASTGSVTLANDLTVIGTLSETLGDIILNGHVLTISGPVAYSAGTLVGTSSSSIVINVSGSINTLAIGGGALNSLTINRTGATITCSSAFTLSSLNLIAGTFTNAGTITMASGGALVTRDGGFLSNPVGAATTFDVTYLNGTGSAQNTGPELPANISLLRNLTINSTNQVNLNAPVTINGDLTFTNGIFNSGSNAIDLKGNLISNNSATLTGSTITFSGPSSTITGVTAPVFGNISITGSLSPNAPWQINGNLVNTGTLLASTSSVTFGGNTTISGSSTSAFNNVIIASTLVAPSNFNVKGNWTNNGTFTHGSNTNTITFNGNTTIGGTAAAPNSDFSGIIIAGSSTLTAPALLNISGSFSNGGSFVAGTGTVVFNGTVNQFINGTTNTVFNNLSSANNFSLTVSTPQSVSGALTILPGASGGTINANGKLTLLSTSAGDAYIAPINNGSITNGLIVQRYLPNPILGRAYRYLASPFTDATVSQWKAEFPITGVFTDPSSGTGIKSSSPSMYLYNEAHTPTTTTNDRYEPFPASGQTSTSTIIANGKGYAAYNRLTSPMTLSLSGTPAQGDVSVAVTNQSGSVGGNDGWNLVGNPYAATINWNNVSLPSGINSQIVLKDNTDVIGIGAGSYVYYSQGGPGIPATYTGDIVSGQSFFIRANATSILTFKESHKVGASTQPFIRSGSLPDVARLHVAGNGSADEMVIQFKEGNLDKGDRNDAFKLSNDFINLYSYSSDGSKLAINQMSSLDCYKKIALGLDNVTPGSYQFNFSELNSFANGIRVQLTDSFAGTSKVVSASDSLYAFTVTTDSASFGSKRFNLTFTSAPIPTTFAFQKADVCEGMPASVAIDNTTPGISYYLTLNGNQIGGAQNGNSGLLTFPIAKESLTSGVNRFFMTAVSSGCSTGTYVQKDSITVTKIYSVSQVSATTSCQPGNVTITASGAPGNGYYNWYVNQTDSAAISGETAATYVTPSLAKSATYYVAAVNALGCEGTRKAILAPVVNYENAKITQVDAVTLSSNFTTGNQWYLDGTLLPDTTATLTVKKSGTYTLHVSVGTCVTTDEQILLVTGLESGSVVKAYPNPVSSVQSVYNVEIPDPDNKLPEQLPVFNTLGSQIGTMPLTSSSGVKKGTFDFAPQTSGLYYIRVVSGSSVTVLKVIKK